MIAYDECILIITKLSISFKMFLSFIISFVSRESKTCNI